MCHSKIKNEKVVVNMVRTLLTLSMVLLFGATATKANDDASKAAPRYEEPIHSYFEFGLKITSNGESTGILGTVPVPIDWPEQKIEFVTENKTDNLRSITFKNLKSNVRQMILKANRLQPGEVAQGSIVVRVKKRNTRIPEDTTKLKFADKIPSKIKQYLRPSPYIESNHKKIKALEKSIPIDESQDAWTQVETIYKWVRDNVEYKFDTKIHSCLDALESGFGDCEELSSIFIAICRAKGIPARAVWIPAHTYPEFFLADENGDGHWFPCQAAGSYEFGAMTEIKPILQKGDRFKLPGNPKVLRYVRPTLVAKDASGGLSIEFIAKQITEPDEIKKFEAHKETKSGK